MAAIRFRAAANRSNRPTLFAFASDFSATNKFGMYQAKRLGDGGTCTASCTVMTRVVCVAKGHDYE